METAIGPIFRLNRMERKYVLNDLTEKTNLSRAKISNFENGKIKLPDNEVRELYTIIGIALHDVCENEVFRKVSNVLFEMYNSIYYGKKADNELKQLNELKENARYTYPYITWLFGEFLYYVYNYDETYNYEKAVKTILNHKRYLSEKIKQMMYDTVGVYYKNQIRYEIALSNLKWAIQTNIDETVLAMAHYHQAMIYVEKGSSFKALSALETAKRIFDSDMNHYRSFLYTFELATVHAHFKEYKKAEELLKKCLKDPIAENNKIMIYNNMIWNYILMKNLDSAIRYSQYAINVDENFPLAYMYLTYIYWKKDNNGQVERYRKLMLEKAEYANKYDRYLLDAISTLTSRKTKIKRKEKDLMRAFINFRRIGDANQSMFVLELLISLFDKDLVKKTEYMEYALDLYNLEPEDDEPYEWNTPPYWF